MRLTLSAGLPPPVRAGVRIAWALVFAACAAHAVHIAAGVGADPGVAWIFDGWIYSGIILAGALLILARAVLVADERPAWMLIGAAVLVWSSGDIVWWRVLSGAEEVAYPSPADYLYLLFFPLLYAGLILLLRARVRRFHASQWLDGIAAALFVAAVGTAILLPPIVDANEGVATMAVATNLAYPLGDLLVLGLVAAVAGMTGWRPGRAVGLLAAGCLTFTLADSVYLFQVAAGDYAEGGLLDLCWPVGVVFMALGAWQPSGRARPGRLEAWGVM
ncbi:MAG: GGDEF-domain containing protein, partial [Thermoleophilia bacterium]|nr:GGDEF-domain containing protein [Thermoleophilia bacterium]